MKARQILAKRQHAVRRAARTRFKIIGEAGKPRLSIFRSGKHIYGQIIDDVAGKTIASSSDLKMKKGDMKPLDAASAVGLDLAEKAIKKGVLKVVFDRGRYKFHGRVKAIADGARKGGLEF